MKFNYVFFYKQPKKKQKKEKKNNNNNNQAEIGQKLNNLLNNHPASKKSHSNIFFTLLQCFGLPGIINLNVSLTVKHILEIMFIPNSLNI